MKTILTTIGLTATLLLAGCGTQNIPVSSTSADRPLEVVSSFYPLYEIVTRVGGIHVKTRNLVPAGAEPHEYDLSPEDIIALNKASLVLYNGAGLEPWADKIIPDLEKRGIRTFNQSQSIVAAQADPHSWLDPVLYAQSVGAITKKLSEIDPPHRAYFEANSLSFIRELTTLDRDYKSALKNCTQRSFVTNHAAFAYLATRYGLEMIAISGLSPDAEPSPRTLAQLTEVLRQKNIQYILVETLVSTKIAETLAKEVGATTLELNPLEGLTDEEMAASKNYISVMRDNLISLKTALQCR